MQKKTKPKATNSSSSNPQESYPWWKDAVIYQIYPRSFQDSNGDGIGDLQGILDRLDYLNGDPNSLGIDAIWLSPIYPSPMVDFGYDISDYENIDPIFGDMYTFKLLLKECHNRNIKVVMDLVINHTSNLHPWFLESKSSANSPKRDWYIWKKPNKKNVPNNWMSVFGGKGWEWDESTEEYYYHSFTPEQPDLNLRNPDVKNAIFKMIQFWLDLGVDGFRLDVVNFYYKDDKFRNNPSHFFKGLREYEKQDHIYDIDQSETHTLLEELRNLLDSYEGNRMSIGEIFMYPPGNAELPASYYGKETPELHMAFNFSFLYCKWTANSFQKVILEWEKTLGYQNWPNYTLSNHDQVRHITKYSKGNHTLPRAKIAAVMLLTLRGTPFLYYGEEIGMESDKIPRNKLCDPLGKRYWPLYSGRDNCRQPMCWNSNEQNFGFSKAEPWLPISKNGSYANVDEELKNKTSLLSIYKKLIQVRKKEIVLRRGSLRVLFLNNDKILSYIRMYEKERILILLNFTPEETRFFSGDENLEVERGKVLFSTHRKEESYFDLNIIALLPYEASIIKLET